MKGHRLVIGTVDEYNKRSVSTDQFTSCVLHTTLWCICRKRNWKHFENGSHVTAVSFQVTGRRALDKGILHVLKALLDPITLWCVSRWDDSFEYPHHRVWLDDKRDIMGEKSCGRFIIWTSVQYPCEFLAIRLSVIRASFLLTN